MKLEEYLRDITITCTAPGMVEIAERLADEVQRLRREIVSIDRDKATAHDYEVVLIKMGELILNDIN